jgi:hypothetical protein
MNNDQYLKDLKPEKEELESFILSYSRREALGTMFIPTLEFINQEISDITIALKDNRIMGIDAHISPVHTVPIFNHSFCASKVYESLSRGHNLTVGHVIATAKETCEKFNRDVIARYGRAVVAVPVTDSFNELCLTWIRTGICFMYYIRFLYKKKEDHQLTFDKFNTLIINYGDGAFINTGDGANNQVNIKIDKQNPAGDQIKTGADQ